MWAQIVGNSASDTADACHALHQAGIIPPYEDILADAYRRFLKEGDVAVDIGVNHGFHFDRLTQHLGPQGRVIGFEPVPDFIAVVRAKHGSQADIRAKALSSAPGRSSFLYMKNAIGESGFKERASMGNRDATPIDVEVSTLDIELHDLPHLAFVKIDVEGHEIAVLTGGEALIGRTRPILGVEYGRPTYSLYGLTADSLYDWAGRAGYRISDLVGHVVTDRKEWLYVCDRSYWDYLLIPNEKVEYWRHLFLSK